ncbi:MAG: succinyl-diaminopimelate desuccinylase [unclassified Hahellaceae]|nr:succinyl-diaminopimelate desuccinylase [Hahellaceae bacterium]|tara:strand:- start:8100 stop:9260 length:1161 start_codon:yes stop_codon:yes gene_type:complete
MTSHDYASDPTLALAQALIRRASVTPLDVGCQDLLASRLEPLGFNCQRLPFGDVENLWATRGDAAPRFVFAGHTDVVPTGPATQWTHPPFEGLIRDGMLHGRGAADMKGSIAAFITACERLLGRHPELQGSLGLLITSDEEGKAVHGTVKVIEHLEAAGQKFRYCLVGEPSSTRKVGDIIKNGRRGSLGAVLTVKGIQGHVAYPHLARNPIHLSMAALHELSHQEWDGGNDSFPPTTLQISNINSGTGATNVIPGSLEAVFNLRFSTELDVETIQLRVAAILAKHELDYDIEWTINGLPFLTEAGDLVAAAQAAVQDICGYPSELSTSGGTSDGRFIAPTGAQVIELGPLNATIHRIDEQVSAEDLITLSKIYERIMERLLVTDQR